MSAWLPVVVPVSMVAPQAGSPSFGHDTVFTAVCQRVGGHFGRNSAQWARGLLTSGPGAASLAAVTFSVIHPDTMYPTTGYNFSHAVRMGDLIFVSGQVGLNEKGELVGKGDVRAQTEQAFENIRAVLEAAGSSLDKVGKVTVLTTSLEYRPIIHEVRAKVFEPFDYYPASTLAVITSLAN